MRIPTSPYSSTCFDEDIAARRAIASARGRGEGDGGCGGAVPRECMGGAVKGCGEGGGGGGG